MKKLNVLCGVFVAIAILGTLPAYAQTEKTYLSENFQQGRLDSTVWNLQSSTKISDDIGPSYHMTYMSTIWGGWCYDPKGSTFSPPIETPIDGSYELISKPFTLDTGVANVISLRILHSAPRINWDRKFAIRLRAEGGEWETIEELSGMEAYFDKNLSIAVDKKWAGKSQVELGFRFTNVYMAGEAFIFFIDDILFASYPAEVSVETEILHTPYFLAASNMDLALRISNPSALAIDKIQYAYTINDKEVRTAETSLESALEPLSGTTETTVTIDLQDATIGNNKMKLWPIAINGTTIQSDTAEWSFSLIDGDQLSQTYTPILEYFTSSTCAPCAFLNQTLTPALDELGEKINVIKYQLWFPSPGDRYFISENRTRLQFYDRILGWNGNYGVPCPVYNGEDNIYPWGNGNYITRLNMLVEKVEAANNQKAYMDMTIKEAKVETTTSSLTIELEVIPHLDVTASIVVAVMEKKTVKNIGTNGETEFFHVNMAMPASANGEKKVFTSGQAQTFTYKVSDMKKTNMEEISDLEVLCFVQDPSNAYIFQSVKADVDTITSIVDREKDNYLPEVKIYPNPANEWATLTGLDHARIEIYDLTGRNIYEKKNVNSQITLPLSAFAEGSYIVRISQNGKSANRKLIIAR